MAEVGRVSAEWPGSGPPTQEPPLGSGACSDTRTHWQGHLGQSPSLSERPCPHLREGWGGGSVWFFQFQVVGGLHHV